MNLPRTLLLAASTLSLCVSGAYADTEKTNKSRAATERDASPSAPVKQDEERTAAHSQPDVPNAGGTEPRNTAKAKPKSATSVKGKKEGKAKDGSSSTGSSRPSSSLSPEKMHAFKAADLDGDGSISKAEAAGNAELTTHFDRADRNRDGQLSQAEYAVLENLQARAQARAVASGR